MKIAIGCDHAAYQMKAALTAYIKGKGHTVINKGTDGPDSVDYPDYAKIVSESVISGEADRGILICGTGLGMSMAANKHPEIRAALCSEPVSAALSRQHNDSNMLCLGARMVGQIMAEAITQAWIDTAFDGGRHMTRLEKFSK